MSKAVKKQYHFRQIKLTLLLLQRAQITNPCLTLSRKNLKIICTSQQNKKTQNVTTNTKHEMSFAKPKCSHATTKTFFTQQYVKKCEE